MYVDSTHKVTDGFTAPEAVLNLIVLMSCIFIVLFVLDKYLNWREQRA